jgi:hypothetical protein
LDIQLGGTSVGTQYDKLNVAGQLSLGGTLAVSLINSFHPAVGNTFDILDWNSLSGMFSSVNLPTLGGRIVWDSSHLYSNGALSIIATYYAGDFNRDGVVNAADILIAEQALANISSYKTAHRLTDPTLFNGTFNSADVQFLLTTLKNGGGSADPVPEPCTLALFASGLLFFTSGTFRKSRRNCR